MMEPYVKCKNCGHGIINISGRIFHKVITKGGIEYTQRLCWFGGIKNNIPDCECMNPEPKQSL